MRKIWLSRIAIMIGCLNWIIVLTAIVSLSISLKSMPIGVSIFMSYYLRYSYLSAVISLALTVLVDRKYKLVNIAINIIFILLYTLVFLFLRYMSMHG